jgi:hypothetical protein
LKTERIDRHSIPPGRRGRAFGHRFLAALLAYLSIVCSAPVVRTQELHGGALPSKPDADGFVALFNGRNLNGWNGLSPYWSVKSGAIRGHQEKARSKQTFLVFAGFNVKDFELRLRYRFASPAGNSGIQFRSKVLDPAAFRVGGYQADLDAALEYAGTIYDEAGVAGDRGTMSNRGEATVWDGESMRHSTPLKERAAELKRVLRRAAWNDADLVVRGAHIIYTINGHVMTDLIDDSPAALKEGVLALQLHEGFTMDVRFKDLRLRVLTE